MLPIVGLEEGAGFEPAAGGSLGQVVPAPDFKSGGFSLSPNPPVRQGGPRGSRTLRGTVDEAPPGKPAWPASLDGVGPSGVSPVRFSLPFNQAERVRCGSRKRILRFDESRDSTYNSLHSGLTAEVGGEPLVDLFHVHRLSVLFQDLLGPSSDGIWLAFSPSPDFSLQNHDGRREAGW